jgi:hypothetical protein
MGKAAVQRRLKRMKYLARLAKEDPEGFGLAWEKRVSSWMGQVKKDAGRLRTCEGNRAASPFERVDEAMEALSGCGEEMCQRHALKAFDLLTTECCRQVAAHADRRLFRLNNYGRFPSRSVETEPAGAKAGRSEI